MTSRGRAAAGVAGIALADGVCVACGRVPGALYRSCPFCGERVWHSPWRRLLLLYMSVLLPLLLAAAAAADFAALNALYHSVGAAAALRLLPAALAAGILLLPHENRALLHTASGSRTRWLLNGAAASALLLLCALLLAAQLRFSDGAWSVRLALCALCVSGAGAPLVMNCPWSRLIPAVCLTLALVLA
jgi:hypothetical protein